ncbi:hypothetical protein [Microbacterium neimengense]
MRTRSVRLIAPMFLLALVPLAGCQFTPLPESSGPDEALAPSGEPTQNTDESGSDDLIDGDVFAERDAFFEAQQQIPGDPMLTPKTPEQQEFISQQRAYTESQGGTWSPEIESITLALALDACETSILNGHDVDQDLYATHVATSPLISALTNGDPTTERNVTSIMVFGTGFLCPADAPQWESAFRAATGG